MDEESSYESDISETWSLIDINLNEELPLVADASFKLKKSPSSKSKNFTSKETVKRDVKDFISTCKDVQKTDFSLLNDSDSSSKSQEFISCNKAELDGIKFLSKKDLEDDGKNDSGDADSIEILNVDGNYQDSEIEQPEVSSIDQFDFPINQTDDEESLEERINKEDSAKGSSVIKKLRRRVIRNSEDLVHSVNSENISLARNSLKACSNDKLIEESNQAKDHPVYQHYKNNIANAVLSLSIGVIVVGVAYLASGHFFGVKNDTETSVELVDALKKLRVENAALQSRLFHLNRVLLNLEKNSKLELPINEPHEKISCKETPQLIPSNTREADLSSSTLPESRSSLNSIEWLKNLQNFLRKDKKVSQTENEIDSTYAGKSVNHHQVQLSKKEEEEGAKILKNLDTKISKVLQKISNRLSSSQDNLEHLYQKIVKIKNKLNQKFSEMVADSQEEIRQGHRKHERRVPVTEVDLQTIVWNPQKKINRNSDEEYSESVELYGFPQTQKYYEKEGESKSINEKQIDSINLNGTLENEIPETVQKYLKKNKRKGRHKNENKKNNRLKEKWKSKEFKEKTRGSRKKLAVNKVSKAVKTPKKGSRKKKGVMKSEHIKYTDSRTVFNETSSQIHKYSKPEGKALKPKRRFKKIKNPKKVFLSKLKKRVYLPKIKQSRMCSGFHCFNLTGYWVFKRANGREEFRRYQILGDWQFDRAKARREGRDVNYYDNWMFERAKARRELRDDHYNEDWQFRRATAKVNNRNDDSWYRGKHTTYDGNGFFHESFSWM